MPYGAIAGMGIGSVMGFMGSKSANKAAAAAYAQNAEMTAVKRQWIEDRMNLQHRQSSISRVFATMAVEKQRLQAASKNRAAAGYRGVAFTGSVKHRDDIINAVDAANAFKGVSMAAHARDISLTSQAWADDFAAYSALNQLASQTISGMQDPLMGMLSTGLGMGASGAAIGGAFSPPSGGGTTVNNYGMNFGGTA